MNPYATDWKLSFADGLFYISALVMFSVGLLALIIDTEITISNIVNVLIYFVCYWRVWFSSVYIYTNQKIRVSVTVNVICNRTAPNWNYLWADFVDESNSMQIFKRGCTNYIESQLTSYIYWAYYFRLISQKCASEMSGLNPWQVWKKPPRRPSALSTAPSVATSYLQRIGLLVIRPIRQLDCRLRAMSPVLQRSLCFYRTLKLFFTEIASNIYKTKTRHSLY